MALKVLAKYISGVYPGMEYFLDCCPLFQHESLRLIGLTVRLLLNIPCICKLLGAWRAGNTLRKRVRVKLICRLAVDYSADCQSRSSVK
jgi:hypothetical protein